MMYMILSEDSLGLITSRNTDVVHAK